MGFFQAASRLGTWYTGIGHDGRKPTILDMGNTNIKWDKTWANWKENQVLYGGVNGLGLDKSMSG